MKKSQAIQLTPAQAAEADRIKAQTGAKFLPAQVLRRIADPSLPPLGALARAKIARKAKQAQKGK